MTGYANPDALVDTGWLADHLDDRAVRIIDVDEDTTAYEKGHIPGAIGWHWFNDLHDPLRRDFIDQAGLTELLRKGGVNRDTTVVLYSGNNNWFAAYAYWLLRYLGFDNVKLLDGGRQKWELEGRELRTEVPSLPPGNVELGAPVRQELRALRDDVLSRVGTVAFVDVRSPEEYRGEKLAPDQGGQRGRHLQVRRRAPGAVRGPGDRW
jgi:thiosulfate/3-mercaptopyruvate sulfurtransferase